MSFNAFLMSVFLSCSSHILMVYTEKLRGPSHGSKMFIQQTHFTSLVEDSPYIFDWFDKCIWINFILSNYLVNHVKFTYSDSYHREWKF